MKAQFERSGGPGMAAVVLFENDGETFATRFGYTGGDVGAIEIALRNIDADYRVAVRRLEEAQRHVNRIKDLRAAVEDLQARTRVLQAKEQYKKLDTPQ